MITVLDANMSGVILRRAASIAKSSSTPIWFEPVSVSKSRRILDLVHAGLIIDYASPNLGELVAMAKVLRTGEELQNIDIEEESDVNYVLRSIGKHASAVIEAGVRCIILTLGRLGAASIKRHQDDAKDLCATVVPGFNVVDIMNVHGAGDALVGGCISCLVQNMNLEKALAYGVSSSVAALRSEGSRLSPSKLDDGSQYSVQELSRLAYQRSYSLTIKV